eukprot:CAMPEP_0119041756 /NCGR_PEP_ID=MMETSP1177-20130426/13446_1 /TAXON_ID=2985 /ORGANISM="Ochromonas sp, Strain CCMP1899" /LENGTH=215 /DNA_ID=CAMNT_0007008049 /DNA_START=84 /DNA_END=731 /DNA_ORIENTATION=+
MSETGQAMMGLTVSGTGTFKETFARHRPLMRIEKKRSLVALGAFVAPSASLLGSVLLYGESSVWYGAVLRGDKASIEIGQYSCVQDRAVIDTVTEIDTGFSSNVVIEDYVSIGAGALLTSCTINNSCSIGAGAIIQAGTIIESFCIVAPGSVVLPNTYISTHQFWAGNPAVYIRDVTDDEVEGFEKNAQLIYDLAEKHDEEFLPYGTLYQEAEKL